MSSKVADVRVNIEKEGSSSCEEVQVRDKGWCCLKDTGCLCVSLACPLLKGLQMIFKCAGCLFLVQTE